MAVRDNTMSASARDGLAPLLIRLIVGCVFLSEGIQKFLFADALGVGRFQDHRYPGA